MANRFFNLALAFGSLLVFTYRANAQMKIGYINFGELMSAMPEFNRVKSSLAEFRDALDIQYNEMLKDLQDRDSILNAIQTIRYTPPPDYLRRCPIGDFRKMILDWPSYSDQLYEQKRQQLLTPVYDKAKKAIIEVAKENGYSLVLSREQLPVSPSSDDLLLLVKKKLGLK